MATDDPNKLKKSQKYKMACGAIDRFFSKTLDNPGSRPRRSPVKIICKGRTMLASPMIVDSAPSGSATVRRADELRQDANASELAVADALCLLGFEHSVPKCGYYLDFYNPLRQLCIEIDGSSHKDRKDHDRRRDVALWKNGIQTWRFPARWSREDAAGLLNHIKCKLAKLDENAIPW